LNRNSEYGYTDTTNGENLASGIMTPQEAFDRWASDDGHRANMLNSSFCAIGIARTIRAHSRFGIPAGGEAGFWATDFGGQLDFEIIHYDSPSGAPAATSQPGGRPD
jgi:uncharacterized protein YkwD